MICAHPIPKVYNIDDVYNLDQESIMEYYLGFFSTKKNFFSPFRNDRSPGCRFFYSDKSYFGSQKKLNFVDYSQGQTYDCIDVVMKTLMLSFQEAIGQIITDLLIIKKHATITNFGYNRTSSSCRESEKKEITVVTKKWQKGDINFWTSFGLNSEILNKFNCYSIAKVWYDHKLIYEYNEEDPCFGYENKEGEWKIYFPQRKKSSKKQRFISNCSFLQGYAQLPSQGNVLVITSSLKDVMVLHKYGVSAIAPSSEGVLIPKDIMDELKERFCHIYINGDYDPAGIRMAKKYKKHYGLCCVFTHDKYNKDISDFRKINGDIKTRKLIYNYLKMIDYEINSN